ncbi:putative methyltransferase-domain-containing protein [Podospora aff. communis PSN243]|uniref:Methyltransferase-domain-containing protein n=1 Tax=Podospora aff. communis PSN243 TaxID=3040156 RepID=A0AAV9GTR7_9PEZI|nr:putative methyltransferase-domain-containing protein [Podospora aff. communis PSN243]
MRPAGRPLPPTSSLPPLRQLKTLSESQVLAALDNLFAIYYPVAVPKSALYEASRRYKLLDRLAPATDSGYNSGYASEDDDDTGSEVENELSLLRGDDHERAFATRWLEKFIARVAEDEERPGCFASEDTRQSAGEKAADLLVALLSPQPDEQAQDEDEEDDGFYREFNFPVPGKQDVLIRLNDGLAGKRADDHTDVGLQTWGASIVFCRMMCETPERFDLCPKTVGTSPRIVELGAGTGLVSLVLGRLLPQLGFAQQVVVATDYHPSVIANLCCNIAANFPEPAVPGTRASAVQACELDWAQTNLDADWPLGDAPADIILATDVVYAPEHADMLYHCASRLLAPHGVFWLLQTVRQNGRFGSVADAVEAVFPMAGPEAPRTGRLLKILESERLEKRNGVGRGDETFYRLFRIGWA